MTFPVSPQTRPIEKGKWESGLSLSENHKISIFSFSVFFLSLPTFPFSSHFPKKKVTFAVGKSTFPCNVHTKNRTYIFQFFIFCSSSPLSHFPTFPLSHLPLSIGRGLRRRFLPMLLSHGVLDVFDMVINKDMISYKFKFVQVYS